MGNGQKAKGETLINISILLSKFVLTFPATAILPIFQFTKFTQIDVNEGKVTVNLLP